MNVVEQSDTGDSLICPHCKANMNHVVERDMTYEKCPRCDGLFLDPGELNALATGMPGDIEYCSIQADDDDQDRFPVRVCPKCPGQKMKKENLLVYSLLIFDLCENCHGWFLDRGELGEMNTVLSELRRGEAEYREKHRDRLVTVNQVMRTEVLGEGPTISSVAVEWTRVDAYFKQALNANLQITPEAWAAKLWKLFGAQDVKTGDEEFDRTFLVKGESAAKARQVLSASARSAVLSFYRSGLAKLGKKRTFEVLDDRVSVCYSDWGEKEFAPTESDRQNLIEALVDVVIAIDEPKRS